MADNSFDEIIASEKKKFMDEFKERVGASIMKTFSGGSPALLTIITEGASVSYDRGVADCLLCLKILSAKSGIQSEH